MGNRINVKNAKLLEVTENTTGNYAISGEIKLPGLMNIDISLLMATGQLYGDGELRSNISKITGATLKIGVNKVPIEGRQLLGGHSLSTDGVLEVKTTDQPKTVAFYAETEADDGTKEQMWLLCGKAQPFGISGKQTESNINFSTDEITIDFVRREKDKMVFKLADTANKTFTSEKSTKFASHPDMTA